MGQKANQNTFLLGARCLSVGVMVGLEVQRWDRETFRNRRWRRFSALTFMVILRNEALIYSLHPLFIQQTLGTYCM